MPTWTPNRISNPFFSLVLEPAHGGRIVSLETPSGELTVGATPAHLNRARVPDRFGLLAVLLWQESYWHNDLCHRTWPLTAAVTPAQVVVSLRGESSLWPGVSVAREVRVTDDPWIDVGHTLDPGPGRPARPYVQPAFWFSNVVRGRGHTFVPSPVGVLDLPRWPQDQSWCHEPTGGWMAWLDQAGGLAFVTEPAHLRHVRVSHHRRDRVEWIRRRVATVQQANVRLIPFTGLSRVDGVGEAGIVALESSPAALELHFYVLRSGRADIRVQVIDTAGVVEELFTGTEQLQAGWVERKQVQFPSDGTTPWRGRLVLDYGQGPLTTDFTGPATRRRSGVSRLHGELPPAPRVDEGARPLAPGRRPPRRFLFDAIPTPLPDPWVPSHRPNRLRVLALTPTAATQSTLALAHQFDLDLTLLYLPRGAQTPTGNNGIAGQSFRLQLGDRYEGFGGDEVMATWAAALDPARQYDAILLGIGGAEEGWQLLPQTLQAAILNRVQAGTGLVCVRRGSPAGPNPETSTLTGLLPLVLQATNDFVGSWRPSTDPVVRGLPWNVMANPGRIMGFTLRPGAQTLLEIDLTPTVRRLAAARTSFGSGRVLELGWGPYTVPVDRFRVRPAGTDRMDTLRYDQALLARFLHDAAGRRPPIGVQNVTLSGTTARIELAATATPAPSFVMDWLARDRFGVVLGTGRETPTSFPAGGILLVTIPSGAWTVDVTVVPQTGDLAWGAGGRTLDFAITVSPNLTVMDPAEAVVVTAPPVAGAALHVVDTVDGRGRVVARTKTAPATGTQPVSVGSLETPYAEFRVHALDAQGQLIAQAVRRFRVRRRSGETGWPVHYWNWHPPLPQPLLVRHLDTNAALGVWTLFALGENTLDSDMAVAADRVGMPYGVSTAGWVIVRGGTAPDGTTLNDSQGRPIPFSLTDASRIATGRAQDTATAATLADGNVLFYRIADDEPDPPRSDASFDAVTLARFQAWLRELYGHTDSLLQQEWGPSATLASAAPRSFNNAIAAFPAERTYAPWLDHRRFIMELFSRVPALAGEALRRGDPKARTVTSGDNLMAMASGRDWWVRGRALDVVGRYAVSTALELEALGTPSMGWTGYDDPDPVIRYRLWNAFGLRESGQALFSELTLVNPDLSLPEVGRDLAAALLPARRGVGGLFTASEPAADGIYVVSSPDSSCVLAIHGYELVGPWIDNTPPPPPRPNNLGYDTREGVHDLLAAMGVGWRAISPADIETGALDRNRARLLVLPMCVALSDVACEAIRRWVGRGGLVVADLMPAVFTAHGRLRGTGITAAGSLQGSTNPLDAVFGVTPGARPPIARTTTTVNGVPGFSVRCADTGLVASSTASSDGVTAGGAPLFFSNRYQQGQAAYLGCSLFADYRDSNTSRQDRTRMETAFSRLLRSLGVTERVSVKDPTTQERAPLCQFRVREVGTTELVVLLRYYLGIYDPVEPESSAELEFRGPAHTYDIETGTYLGYGTRLAIHLSAYTQRGFARLPYKVTGIDLEPQTPGGLGSRIVMAAAVRVENGCAGKHYLRLDVLDQDGRPIRYLAREALAECGEATFVIQTALNDPPGVWTIRVVDVATGAQGQVQLAMGNRSSAVPQPEPFLIEAIND